MSDVTKPWKKLKFWLLWPGLFLYFTGSNRARVIVVCDNQILLAKDRSKVWFEDSRWSIPGGGIQAQETPTQGGARELHEEIGIQVSAEMMQPLSVERVSEFGLSYQGFFMLLRLETRPEFALQEAEIAEAQWFDIDDATKLDLKKEARRALELLAAQA